MKLQPNFSWQKYEKNAEDQQEQFQYQLQQEHILIANSVNATIDDESFFTRERMTAFTWVNNKPIFTKTLLVPGGAGWVAGVLNTVPTGITAANFTVIDLVCCISDGTTAASTTLSLPHLDTVAANIITIVRVGTDIIIASGGTNRSAFSGYVTVYYIKS